MAERRSARANKGKHSQHELEEDSIYYSKAEQLKRAAEDGNESHTDTPESKPAAKKQKATAQDAYDSEVEDGEVLCGPCGTNKDNYDEETDQGGTMIECETCKTWQHAKCMGYKTKKAIPKSYKCNVCEPRDLGGDAAKAEPASTNTTTTTKAEDAPENGNELASAAKESVKKEPGEGTSTGGGVKIGGVDGIPVIPPTSFYPVVPTYSLENIKDKTRKSVAKAFLNVFQRNLPTDSPPDLSVQYAIELEEEINLFSPRHGQERKYTDRSRSLVVLIKKPNVMKRLLSKELSFKEIVNSSPEEIDDELKKYAEKVRQESIRRSVLTIEDEASQRIRRTHKGEEIVEEIENNHDSGRKALEDQIISGKNIDHRRFEEREESPEPRLSATPGAQSRQNSFVNRLTYDDSDDDEKDQQGQETKGGSGDEEKQEGSAASDSDDDDELDFILRDKKVEAPAPAPAPATATAQTTKQPSPPTAPPTSNKKTSLWSGRVTFPDHFSFLAKATFMGTLTDPATRKHDPTSPPASILQRYTKVGKEIFSKDSYYVEGRLDKSRALAYLEKIISTRDLFIIQFSQDGASEGSSDFKKFSSYLIENDKVGVLSGKPHFVKDSYVLAVREQQAVPSFLQDFIRADEENIFAIFVVKKDYIPYNRSILKKATPPASVPAASNAISALDSILSKLDSDSTYTPPVSYSNHETYSNGYEPNGYSGAGANQQAPDASNPLSGLSTEQLQYLSGLVQQNPHVQNNPQSLIQLLQQQKDQFH